VLVHVPKSACFFSCGECSISDNVNFVRARRGKLSWIVCLWKVARMRLACSRRRGMTGDRGGVWDHGLCLSESKTSPARARLSSGPSAKRQQGLLNPAKQGQSPNPPTYGAGGYCDIVRVGAYFFCIITPTRITEPYHSRFGPFGMSNGHPVHRRSYLRRRLLLYWDLWETFL
jgi:hypothetical protein